MKKVLLACAILCSAVTAIAQQEETTSNPTDKGHFIVDGSVSFAINNSKSEGGSIDSDNKWYGVAVSPKAAYFIMDRLALGLEVSFNYSESEFTNADGLENSQNNTAIAVGPFARYYLVNGLFGQVSAGFGTSKSNSDANISKSNQFRYQLGIGYAIFLGSQVSLEPIFNYRYVKNTNDSSDRVFKSNSFSVGAGFTIYL